jgi:hypothetical protein
MQEMVKYLSRNADWIGIHETLVDPFRDMFKATGGEPRFAIGDSSAVRASVCALCKFFGT